MHPSWALGKNGVEPPRIGIPYRRASEERAGDWEEIRPYAEAVEQAGGKAEIVSLFLPIEELERVAGELDGFLLPGSPADVDPAKYGEKPAPPTAEPDTQRERTDEALLANAFRAAKPVLTICYGTQLLNVYRGGTLVQDIASLLPASLSHRRSRKTGAPEPHHPVQLVPGSQVARLAETVETVVNSLHHQSIGHPGRGLRVTGKASDGVVEAVELEDAKHWVIGVQWHPERQREEGPERGDSGIRLAQALFRDLIRAAAEARAERASGTKR